MRFRPGPDGRDDGLRRSVLGADGGHMSAAQTLGDASMGRQAWHPPSGVPVQGAFLDEGPAAAAADPGAGQRSEAGRIYPARTADPGFDAAGQSRLRVRLRILATTDLHGQLLSYDYYANRKLFGQGLAQTAALIEAARAEVPGTLLFDNGDFLQGSALVERAVQLGAGRGINPAIAAFNTLGYDAVALGNHEFNHGLDALQEALEGAIFPVLSANVALELGAEPGADRHLVAPSVLLTRDLPDEEGRLHRIRIGVLGLTPTQIMHWDGHHLAGRIEVRPMVQAARAHVALLRASGADVVVCLAHTGLCNAHGPQNAQGADADAAEIVAIAGIDAVVAGHSHLVYPAHRLSYPPALTHEMPIPPQSPLLRKPCVQPGHSGSHLGVIDLWLERRLPIPQHPAVPAPRAPALDHLGTPWQVVQAQSQASSTSEMVAALSPDEIRNASAPLRGAIGKDHRATLAWLRREIAVSWMPLHSHFGTIADGQGMRVIAAALSDHVRAALKEGAFGHLPVVASVSPFRSGGRGGPLNYTDIPAGPISLRNIYDLYPFPNRLVAKMVTGRDLRERLERGTAVFNQISPGLADQPLQNVRVPGFSYEVIAGLSYRIDLSRPCVTDLDEGQRSAVLAGALPGRITELALDGRPVRPEDHFILASNSYLTSERRTAAKGVVLDDGSLCAEVIAQWATARGVIVPQEEAGWSFAPLPGTSVQFMAGAGVAQHLAEIAHFRPEFTGLTADGFHSFRLHL